MATTTRKTTKKRTTKAKTPEVVPLQVSIPRVELSVISVRIDGLSPLICHHADEKLRKGLTAKKMHAAPKLREALDPNEEFNAARYRMDENGFDVPGIMGPHSKYADGLPVRYIKSAMVDAVREVDNLTMARVRGLFHVEKGRQYVPIQKRVGKNKYLTYGTDIEPEVDKSLQRINSKGPGTGSMDPRFRPIYKDWTAEFTITYNGNLFSAEQLFALLNLGGFHVGVCEHRPGKSGGQNGIFQISEEMFAKAAE